MFDKKGIDKIGQVTIFVILAILIVISVILFFVLRDDNGDVGEYDTKTIDGYVESCLEDSLEEAIYFNSIQGGYFVVPEPYVEEGFLRIPIYWQASRFSERGHQDYFPSLDVIESELEDAVKVRFENCTGNFESFRQEVKSIDVSDIEEIDVNIIDGKVSVFMNKPVFIFNNGERKKFENFDVDVNFDFIEKYDIMKEMMDVQRDAGNWMPIFEFSDIAKKHGINYTLVEKEDREFVYMFNFDDELGLGVGYRYGFAVDYDWE